MSGTAATAAPRKADAFVVSCIDPRTTGDTATLLTALGRADRYSEMRIAGAALAAIDPARPSASTALWDNLAASRQLHGIRKVTFINHRDCGAMHAWAGRRVADDPVEEQRLHADVLRRAAAELRSRHPDLLIELKLMNLDGTTQVIPSDIAVPEGFQPDSVGPAAQIVAAVQDEGVTINPPRRTEGQPNPQGFAELLRVRTSGGAMLDPQAELSLLSEGITRYGLTAQQAREISSSTLAALRPTGAAAGRDVRDFLRTRADRAGQLGQRDIADAARLYRRLLGPGTTQAGAERLAASLAEQEGFTPKPRGMWPFRSTRWFQTMLERPPAKAPPGRSTARNAIAAVALAAGLGWAAPAAAQEPGGWLDRFNRSVFDMNQAVFDGVAALRESLPDSLAMPEWLATGAGNVLNNTINEPITALSYAIAGQFDDATVSVQRFGVNIARGYLGARDAATEMGLVVPRADLGLALCKQGVPTGPYMVLPIVGPRTLRDGAADIVLTNAIVWVMLVPVLGPMPGLVTILMVEILDEAAALAVARQIDSADEHDAPFDEVRDRYLLRRAERCAGA